LVSDKQVQCIGEWQDYILLLEKEMLIVEEIVSSLEKAKLVAQK
jgi:hypothetical protein